MYTDMRVSIIVVLFILIVAAALFDVNMYVVLIGFILAMYQLEVNLCDVIELTSTTSVTSALAPLTLQSPLTSNVDFTKPKDQIATSTLPAGVPAGSSEKTISSSEITSTVREPPQTSQDIYGPYYAKWNEQRKVYTDSYDRPQPRVGVSCAERQYDIDSAGALLAQRRTVDRQRNDGWAAKDADYYRYHFAEELDTEENLRWWGREEW